MYLICMYRYIYIQAYIYTYIWIYDMEGGTLLRGKWGASERQGVRTKTGKWGFESEQTTYHTCVKMSWQGQIFWTLIKKASICFDFFCCLLREREKNEKLCG